jgi:hypothetical protein
MEHLWGWYATPYDTTAHPARAWRARQEPRNNNVDKLDMYNEKLVVIASLDTEKVAQPSLFPALCARLARPGLRIQHVDW